MRPFDHERDVSDHPPNRVSILLVARRRWRLAEGRAALVLSLLALVLSMGTGALAASHYLITSVKQIKPSVRHKLAEESGSFTFTEVVQGGPAGKDGAPGAQGPRGEPGHYILEQVGTLGKTGPEGREGRTGATGPTGPDYLTPLTHVCLSIFDLSVKEGSPKETSDQKEDREARQADYAYIWHVGCAEVHTP